MTATRTRVSSTKSRAVDLQGRRFHHLTVVERALSTACPSGQRVTKWMCRCDCGHLKSISSARLLSGIPKSCGCRLDRPAIAKRFIAALPQIQRVCSTCGESFSTKSTNNPPTTCSKQCRAQLLSSLYKNKRWASPVEALKARFASIAQSSSKRGIACSLSQLDVLELYTLQKGACVVTGKPFAAPQDSAGGMAAKNMSPWAISVDRIDSSKAYAIGNVQLTCFAYNITKQEWTHRDVLALYESVVIPIHPRAQGSAPVGDVLYRLWLRAKQNAAKRKLDFSLPQTLVSQLYDQQSACCSRTGRPFSFKTVRGVSNPWKPSLDRIDSRKGYTPDNVQLVCQIYNMAKHTWTDREVLVVAKTTLHHQKKLKTRRNT